MAVDGVHSFNRCKEPCLWPSIILIMFKRYNLVNHEQPPTNKALAQVALQRKMPDNLG